VWASDSHFLFFIFLPLKKEGGREGRGVVVFENMFFFYFSPFGGMSGR
jgi:hypothetical protein